jgi:hypothetical protein
MRILTCIIMSLLTVACNLSFETTQVVERDPTPVTQDSGADPMPGCTPTHWVRIVIRADETIESLAAGTGETVEKVLAANCLESQDQLTPGESLWLPVPPPRINGKTIVAPMEITGENSALLTAGQAVVVMWEDFPPAVIQAEFTYYPASSAPSGIQSIGIDDNPSDGISVEWTVPDELDGRLVASARIPGQNHEFIKALELWIFSRP